jgi:hypothetical protein
MSTTPVTTLEDAIRQSGEGWLIDSYAPPSDAITHLRRTLDAVNRRARERLSGNAPELSEAAIVAAFQQHPQQVRGFFQALGGTRTPDMLLMVWRVIQGMEVKQIRLSYRRQDVFDVQVILESPYGEEDEPYHSTNIHDFALFRHIGILEISGRPVFDGFYPLRLRPASGVG